MRSRNRKHRICIWVTYDEWRKIHEAYVEWRRRIEMKNPYARPTLTDYILYLVDNYRKTTPTVLG